MIVRKLNILTISLMLLSFAGNSGALLCAAKNMTVKQHKNEGNRANDETLITIANVIGNNMVLQQNTDAPMWGWGPPNENVSIELDNYPPVVTKADASGKWMVKVPTPKATKGSTQPKHTLTFTGKNNTITVTNILIGDVYFCSGQSNMAFRMQPGPNLGVLNYESEIAAAHYPNIRLHKTNFNRNLTPMDRVGGLWSECDSATVKDFSGVAYYFARELYLNEKVNIPIGVLVAAVGGSGIQSWISREALAADPVLKVNYLDVHDAAPSLDHQIASTILYNGMIAPIHPFAIKGFLWYQGEANAKSPGHYARLQSTMIKDWRTRWGQGNLPFLFVQMPAQGSLSPVLRDQQTFTLLVENTGMAVTLDVGEPTNIHPRDKYSVGKRLSKIALAKIYNQDITYAGPTLNSIALEGNKIRIKYHPASVGSGLAIRWNQNSLNEFKIAGKDGVFYPAVAEISGNDVLVSSPSVPSPQKVAFAYTNNAMPNLMNKDSLTACPFNTETWNYDIEIKAVVTTTSTAVPGLQNKFPVKVYPVPAKNELYISSFNSSLSNKVEMFNLSGKLLMQKSFDSGNENIAFNISNLHAGVYLLKLSNNAGTTTHQIIKY